MPRITGIELSDVRFPTSVEKDGSDAMNKDADYSAAYLRLVTDDPALYGCGFTFTTGRGNDICLMAIKEYAERLVGREASEVYARPGVVYRELQGDAQLRWLGPEKGVVQLAVAAVLNAVWDLAARAAGVPLWQLVSELSPEELVDAMDLSYLSDELTADQALEFFRTAQQGREERLAVLRESGYPCYTTSPGWLGYSDEKLARLCREAVDEGYRHVKLKVGADRAEDERRLRIARETIGPDVSLMIDANQVWEVDQAVDWVRSLAGFDLLWIEEPTSPDDVLGHRSIRERLAPTGIGVATGEHGMNRVLFKQLLQAEAIDFCQIDSCRLASVNEILPVLVMAARRGVPVCPHAGGVGLCELVNHLVMIDQLIVAGTSEGRVAEFVDHLHEHFVDPCVVRAGAYTLPSAPGYSAELKAETLAEFSYPDGSYWARARTAEV
ncbi:fuconate dehydratase [Enemella evansiae]|uniref:enolase C-terminal domain-like protein n=1 Tax=Enemella evansiae TaxID=2016499 RepID=UPI000B965D7C|nr:enolase C-terminal domain-like protein [Enemella evansiae]OYO12290.1 fuconate dehydratase [Enemella evansiae]